MLLLHNTEPDRPPQIIALGHAQRALPWFVLASLVSVGTSEIREFSNNYGASLLEWAPKKLMRSASFITDIPLQALHLLVLPFLFATPTPTTHPVAGELGCGEAPCRLKGVSSQAQQRMGRAGLNERQSAPSRKESKSKKVMCMQLQGWTCRWPCDSDSLPSPPAPASNPRQASTSTALLSVPLDLRPGSWRVPHSRASLRLNPHSQETSTGSGPTPTVVHATLQIRPSTLVRGMRMADGRLRHRYPDTAACPQQHPSASLPRVPSSKNFFYVLFHLTFFCCCPTGAALGFGRLKRGSACAGWLVWSSLRAAELSFPATNQLGTETAISFCH